MVSVLDLEQRKARYVPLDQEVYKVLTPEQTSALVQGDAKRRYSQYSSTKAPEWLAEKGYHITCFRLKADARKFARDVSSGSRVVVVWRCRASGLIEKLPRVLDWRVLSHQEIYHVGGRWPPGTCMVKRLRLSVVVGVAYGRHWFPR